MNSRKLRVAILGTGNIGTDLLLKVLRSPLLECRLFAGRNLTSPGMVRASSLGIPVSAGRIEAILQRKEEIDLVFDATSAADHLSHAGALAEAGIFAVDLTPAKVGCLCCPAINLDEALSGTNVNLISCGGQASIPLAWAIHRANPQIDYIETVSTISSRSAGPATRLNLDEYLATTEAALRHFSGAPHAKAIINLNPAVPCIHMQTTVFAKIAQPDMEATRQEVDRIVRVLQGYIPGYRLVVEPFLDGNRLAVTVRVEGAGDYLPRYAGNLDIINCAAIAIAEVRARRQNEGAA